MRALIIVESIFGNTRRIADAVAAGLAEQGQVDVVEVGDAPDGLAEDVDLLIVGGPTHAWSMSRAATRSGAVQQQPDRARSLDRGIREWLDSLPSTSKVAAAAFDTRLDKSRWMTGSAARAAAKQLRRHGSRVVAVESFRVAGTPGPLCDGETDRARQWGAALGREHASTHR